MTDLKEGFAVIGDSHLIHDTDRLRLTNMHDSLFALQQTVEYCLRERLSLVLAGDLYDKNLVPSRLLTQANQLLEKLTDAQIPLWGIQGNHDKDPEWPWFMNARGARWLGPIPADVGGHQLCGLDFAPSAEISQRLTKVQPCDGLVLHQALQQGLGFDGAWNCDLDWVSGITPNVWIGDLHNVQHELWSSDKKVRAVYTLSQYLTKTDESDSPSFLRVGPRTDGHQPYERVPLAHRPIHRFHLESDDDLTKMIERLTDVLLDKRSDLPELIRRPALIVSYYADIPGVADVLTELTDRGALASVKEKALPSRLGSFATCQIRAETREGLTLDRLVAENTQAGEFQSLMFDLVRSLSIDEARQVLETWRNKIYQKESV